jgi:hypothetical protein
MSKKIDLGPIRAEIVNRHNIIDWPNVFPWWPKPAHVKILFYADGSIKYDGGPFFGLKQVLATLTANHYHWVRFDITTVHRSTDPTADHQGLDLAQALALDSFDELWIYSIDDGINTGAQLTASELAAAKTFMDDRNGGVLITGDHENLGRAFSNLPRAGKMRQFPAPEPRPPVWNTTLRSGANGTFEFDDQSDAVPQPLSLRQYWAGLPWQAPHPVLCSPLGPIDIFPDHQHEGEALAPAPTPASEWPGGVGAEVIARGTIVEPTSNTVGRQIGVLSAYEGHDQGVGRIVADSTWHHHFDINLRGLPGNPDRPGFVTPGTSDWIATARKIEYYYVNVGIWLAPPAKQAAMRAAAWWAALWSDHLLESLGLVTHPDMLGRRTYEVLGRYASPCIVFDWIWSLVPPLVRKRFPKAINNGDPTALIDYVAGVATRQLFEQFDVSSGRFPTEAPSLDDISRGFTGVAERALAELISNMEAHIAEMRSLSVVQA